MEFHRLVMSSYIVLEVRKSKMKDWHLVRAFLLHHNIAEESLNEKEDMERIREKGRESSSPFIRLSLLQQLTRSHMNDTDLSMRSVLP